MIFHKILETLLCKVVEFKLDLKQARLKVQRTWVFEVEGLYGQVVVHEPVGTQEPKGLQCEK